MKKKGILDMVKFSIIIPSYNVSDYIGKTIESVKCQSFTDYEVLVVDDCSCDDGKTVCEIRKHINDKIRLIEKDKNSGSGGTRNVGIDNAQGEYILFLDSDDILIDDKVLERLSNVIDEKKYDIVFIGFEFNDGSFSFLPERDAKSIEYMIGNNLYINVWSICWKRSFILENNIRFREGVLYEDVNFAVTGMVLAKDYYFSNIVTHLYTRVRPNSNSEKNTYFKKHYRQAMDTIRCIEDLSDIYERIVSPLYKNAVYERILEQKGHLNKRLDRGIGGLKENA